MSETEAHLTLNKEEHLNVTVSLHESGEGLNNGRTACKSTSPFGAYRLAAIS